MLYQGFRSGKESVYQCRRHERDGFDLWVGKIPWSRKWQPTPGSFLENPMDRGAWRATVRGGHKESDTTEHTSRTLYQSVLFCFFFGCVMQHVGSYFPDQRSNPCPLHWKCSVLTTEPPRKSREESIFNIDSKWITTTNQYLCFPACEPTCHSM